MSILDEIRKRVESNDLFEVIQRSLRPEGDYRRWVYVSKEVEQERIKRANEDSFRQLSDQFRTFTTGLTIPVALQHDHKRAEWARLDPPGWEVWETRVRFVTPELRVFGRFAAIDVFVVFHLYEGRELKGKKKWDAAKIRCQQDWTKLFPNDQPVFGSTVNAYVRTNFTLI
jgi:hypothetical protein